MTDDDTVGHFLYFIYPTECEWCEEEKECLLGGKYGDGSPTCLDCGRQIVERLEAKQKKEVESD